MARNLIFMALSSEERDVVAVASDSLGIALGDTVTVQALDRNFTVVDIDSYHAVEIMRFISRTQTVFSGVQKVAASTDNGDGGTE